MEETVSVFILPSFSLLPSSILFPAPRAHAHIYVVWMCSYVVTGLSEGRSQSSSWRPPQHHPKWWSNSRDQSKSLPLLVPLSVCLLLLVQPNWWNCLLRRVCLITSRKFFVWMEFASGSFRKDAGPARLGFMLRLFWKGLGLGTFPTLLRGTSL